MNSRLQGHKISTDIINPGSVTGQASFWDHAHRLDVLKLQRLSMMPSHGARSSEASNWRGGPEGKTSKRSGNACTRCRRQKIKCSGTQPCDACKKRDHSCDFDERDQKILVTRGYILDLKRQIRGQRRDESSYYITPEGLETIPNISDADRPGLPDDGIRVDDGSNSGSQEDDLSSQPQKLDPIASSLTNPLAAAPSMFMKASNGRDFYLGTSSNWSFTRRVLSLAHEHMHHSPVLTDALLFDGTTYTLEWDGSRVSTGLEAPVLPSLDHAIYLLNAVKFHCTQIFHLFDEDSFMKSMYEFYAEPASKVASADLSYIHMLLIFAFGKALVGKNTKPKQPPGSDFFVKALQLLPDIHALSTTPVLATEVLCCVALYFQSIDYRNSAHNFIGQAMRMALANGMHTDMPVEHLGAELVERCRRIWWTTYVMDREMTSLMGLPQSVHDRDIFPELPSFSGSVQRVCALRMQIRLSKTIVTINRDVYGANGRLNKNFLLGTKKVLESIAGLADELRQVFPLQIDKMPFNGVPRIPAYLYLLYHQCIVLATRPLLLCFLKIQFESPDTYISTLETCKTAWKLIQMCIESSQQMITILGCLQEQGLLETFLPFDLESLFVSTVNIILGPALDSRFLENAPMWLDKAYELFNECIRSGNLIAALRREELRQLDDILSDLPLQCPRQPDSLVDPELQNQEDYARPGMRLEALALAAQYSDETPMQMPPVPVSQDEYGLDTGLTTAQIMDMANSIANSDTEWMQGAIIEHGIW